MHHSSALLASQCQLRYKPSIRIGAAIYHNCIRLTEQPGVTSTRLAGFHGQCPHGASLESYAQACSFFRSMSLTMCLSVCFFVAVHDVCLTQSCNCVANLRCNCKATQLRLAHIIAIATGTITSTSFTADWDVFCVLQHARAHWPRSNKRSPSMRA